jgi:RNA polymerase sigma-70 factor (ECF subfamily)
MEDALDGRAFMTASEREASDALVAEAAKTDPHAFGELYERYYDRVYRYIYHRLGNPADAEDITALVFMKALEGLPSYHCNVNGFAPWLFRITRNAVVDHYRRRRKQCSLDQAEHESGSEDPVSDVLHSERREELQMLVAHLSPEQRDVVLMRYAADLTFAEIAVIVKKNEAAVRMLLHRGLRKMKAVMDDEQP